ncbi:hypothetical protein DOY81_012708 [Sarcophaga bullata]|nr:hypothetical protein DOY81_012708 [Sarcophaga bullata]
MNIKKEMDADNKLKLKDEIDANNELKLIYHIGTKKCIKYIYFTGSTFSELRDAVDKHYDWDRDNQDGDAYFVLYLYYFDDDDKETKVIINHDDGVKIFMKHTSRLKTRELHVLQTFEYDGEEYCHGMIV